MSTGLYTRWDFNPGTVRFTPPSNKTRTFENNVMSYFQLKIHECKLQSLYSTSRQNRIHCFGVDKLFFIATVCLKQWAAVVTLVFVKKDIPLCMKSYQSGSKKSELDELRRSYKQEESFIVIKKWGCEWLRLYKTTTNVQEHVREKFPYRRSLTDYQLLEKIKRMENCLVMFNATLKYLKIWEQTC